MMAQASAVGSGAGSEGAGLRVKIQRFGSYLSGMVMPNIGAFLAWGLITALFIPDGWLPNATLAALTAPMITYLLPLLIGYTGGRIVYDVRGGVVGAVATMGVIVGTDIPMFLGALIMGPLGGFVIKRFDRLVESRVRQGFEMLVNNFSAGILGGLLAIIGLLGASPIITAVSNALGSGVNFIINLGLLPLVSIFVEPAKILFLNNAINHGILAPLAIEQATEAGNSILFLVETNPGPGFGILLAFSVFGHGISKRSAPGAAIIQFLGGIHEIYFPYVLMRPLLVLAAIAGGASGLFVASIFQVGLVSTPSPGSIFAILALTPRGNFIGVIADVLTATVVSFLVASVILRRIPGTETDDEDESSLTHATEQMEAMKGSKSQASGTLTGNGAKSKDEQDGAGPTDEQDEEDSDEFVQDDSFDYSQVGKIIFACDAGMGSSAMGASLLRNKAKEAGLSDIEVKNTAVNQIPDDADVIITHKDLTDRARQKMPESQHISVDNFLGSPKYDELIDEISAARV
jgi:PTS system mannitol-specific IIC component